MACNVWNDLLPAYPQYPPTCCSLACNKLLSLEVRTTTKATIIMAIAFKDFIWPLNLAFDSRTGLLQCLLTNPSRWDWPGPWPELEPGPFGQGLARTFLGQGLGQRLGQSLGQGLGQDLGQGLGHGLGKGLWPRPWPGH